MTHTVTAGPTGRSILVQFLGDFDAADARHAAAAVAALRAADGRLRDAGLVCDVRGARNRSGLGRNYLFVRNDLPAIGEEPGGRVAVVADPADGSHDFVVACLADAGFDVEAFTDPAAAAAWAEGGPAAAGACGAGGRGG